MRRTSRLTLRIATGLVFCGALHGTLPSGYPQSKASSRVPAGVRFANPTAGLDSLETIQSQAIGPRPVRPVGESISVHELVVPPGAIKEFQRSEKAIRSGNFLTAAEHLQKALQIDPNFVQAHNNLGASYLQLNEYESAVTEFRKAIDLDPKIQETQRNLALGLFLLRRYAEAEVAARQALQLNSQKDVARYTLGRILAAKGSASAEAEQLLRQSIPQFVDARLPLAQVLLNRGATEEAANELRSYMKSPDANEAKMKAVQIWLSRIALGTPAHD